MPPFAHYEVVARSDLILGRTDAMADRILERVTHSPTKTVDIAPLLGVWSVEVICKVAFNSDVSDEQRLHTILKSIEGAPLSLLINSILPFMRTLSFRSRLPGIIGHTYRSASLWKKETASMLADFQKQDLSKEEKKHFLGGHLFSTPHKISGQTLTFDQALEESMGTIIAGAQVTQHTLLFLLNAIGRPEGQSMQERLRKELQGVADSITELVKLPFLGAVIKETYRVHPGIISTLPRILKEPLVIRDSFGLTLPPGTVVGMQNYVHHRDPELFPQPDSFIPERWLEGHELARELKDMNAAITPYSLGTRSCLGQNLAKAELHLAVARLLRRIQFTTSSSMKEDDLIMEDSWVVRPQRERLLVEIESLEN